MAIARMRRACLASAIRAASARNCEILRSWRVISIADMLPRSPNQQQDESSHVCGCLGIPQESDSRALGIIPLFALRGRSCGLLRSDQERKAGYVVGEIFHADFGCGAGDADGADVTAVHGVFDMPKDMLDTNADT